jgi:hypothetical protein
MSVPTEALRVLYPTGTPYGVREAGLRPSTGVRNRDGKPGQCGGWVSRHKGATAPLGVPSVVARGVTWRPRLRPPHRLRVYVSKNRIFAIV